MSKRVKRWKLQDRNTQSDSAITISDHGEAPPQLVYMEGQDLQSWVDFISEARLRVRDSLLETDSVFSLLQSLCALLNHRGRASLKQNLLVEFFRCMAKHGIPFRYIVRSAISKFFFREEYLEKYIPTMNLKLFFRDLSCLEYRLRSYIWGFHHIQMSTITTTSRAPSLLSSKESANISTMRYQLCYACRSLNYRAVVASLANSEVLRMTSERIERPKEHHYGIAYNIQHMIYFDSPLVIWVAVQATLAMKHDSKFDICGRLVMLATIQSLIYTTTAVKNTILMQLCEILIATILLGSPNHASALVALESRVHRYNKNYENSSVWNAYKLIAEYEEWKKRPAFGGMILNTAQSLVEIAESVHCHGTLFLEAACQIWAKQRRCEDKISNAVSKVLSRCPQLLGRVIRFLKAIELDHEIEVITAEVCQEKDKALSPSDHVWLDWCRPRIEHPERYGKKTEVLSQCANVLFRFLDYGSNRNSTRAWLMLDRAFTFVDTTQMSAIWAERYDWWPQFHVVHLPPEAELRRSELLATLGKVPIE